MKIKWHYTVLILVGLGLLCGVLKNICIIYLLITLHELGHFLFIRLFKRKVSYILILPFGGIINYQNKENTPLFQDFLINGGGLFINAFLCLFLKKGLIHEYNLLILFFNALPIYPLDGGRLLEVFLSKFFKYKKAIPLVSFLSIICLIVVFVINIFTLKAFSTNLILLFLLLENVKLFKDRKRKYEFFLLQKYLYPNDHLKDKEIKSEHVFSSFFKGVNNVLFHKEKKIKEKTILEKYFKR